MSIKQNLLSLLHDEISRLINERAELYRNFGFAVHERGWQHSSSENAKNQINQSQNVEKEVRTALRVIDKLNIDDLVISGANAVSTERQSEVGQATPVTELASENVENKRS
jgi:hypothetical protein